MPQRTMSKCVSGCRIVAGAVRRVHDAGVDASGAHLAEAAVEALELPLELPVAGHVGGREVREDALQRQPGKTAQRLDEVGGVLGRDADPVHAGVDLEVERRDVCRRAAAARDSATAKSRE